MKTKVIVSGGYADEVNEANSRFFSEILKDTDDKVTVLLVLFSKEEAYWNLRSKLVIEQFEKVKGSKRIKYLIANHDQFDDQISECDVIYLRGGDTQKLIVAIAKHPYFKNRIKGKIVAGESAGTYLLSDYFYSKSMGGVHRGIGMISTRTICHFEDINEEQLDKCPDHLQKLLLRDYEHKVYFVN